MPRITKHGAAKMLLVSLLESEYFPLQAGRITDERTKAHYRRAVRWLGDMLGRPARLDDLTDDNLAKLLYWLTTQRRQGPGTANGSHKCLSAFWRWARNKGLVNVGPTTPPLKTPKRSPRAWQREELARLMEAVKTAPGSICGIPARLWWSCLFAIEWDTGCRASELLSLRWEWLAISTGWLVVPAEYRKGRESDKAYGLLPDTLDVLRLIYQPTGLILRWSLHRSRYWQLWRELLERAGLPYDRRSKTQALRRSFASWLVVGGGDASAACGHSSPQVTRQHYLDPTLTAKRHGESMPFRLLDLG